MPSVYIQGIPFAASTLSFLGKFNESSLTIASKDFNNIVSKKGGGLFTNLRDDLKKQSLKKTYPGS